ncbi:MAG: P-loop NTPase [Spirochaetaceae bacterium]|nr:P-loop NTPase [Spirochaetaceae bacterium]
MIQKKDILKVLSQIEDPDLHKDIVSLGFIKELVIDGSSVSFSIELTTAGCPLKNMFKTEAEKLVLSIDGVEKVQVVMTARQTRYGNSSDSLKKVKHVIAVASAKGGVGKSTIAATLACEFAAKGFKVGLLDTDLFGPSLPTLFNIHESQIVQRENMLIPMEYNGLKLMSFGFLLGDAPAIMRGPMVSGYIQQLLTTVEWGELDYLFIDMPPGTGDIQLTISQTIKLDGAVIVTTRSSLSLVDVARGILMFEKVQIPTLGVVENMAYFICDNCEKEHFIFGEKKSDLSERFGIETIAHIPVDSNRAKPFDTYETNAVNSDLADSLIRQVGKISADAVAPPEVKLLSDRVIFTWLGNPPIEIENHILRDACKCALCVDEYSGEKTLKTEDIPQDIHALEVTPLGNYAVSIQWSDGHTSSIYPYKTIRSIDSGRAG